ncbi:MAG: hypothetical protein IT395_05665 [Candidatus Omnitrophica bacterium]|nr:hypothetical protein [Candidatus Omnitrophota bacterium]
MRRIIQQCFVVLLFVGMVSPGFAQGKIKELFVTGIRTEDKQFLLDPQPETSEYLITRKGGFSISEYGARYLCGWDIIKDRPKTIFVRMELQNPLDANNPVVQEGEIDAKGQTLNIAFGPIKGLKMHELYTVKVFLYEDQEKTVEIDHLTQNIKSYVDTRKDKVAVDKNLVVGTGEKISKVIKTLNAKEVKRPSLPIRGAVKFAGEVKGGETFEKELSDGLVFRLMPIELGWTIFIGTKEALENNFAVVVTPPYRGINALYIHGWNFRNSDNSGPNEHGPKMIDAPAAEREFQFVLNEADFKTAMDSLQKMLWPHAYTQQQVDQAATVHEKLKKGRGLVVVKDLQLNNLEAGKQAGIDAMKFEVELGRNENRHL